MDQASKDMLKRDLFVQGLLWKWQEKVLPLSANTLDDALYQARIADTFQLSCLVLKALSSFVLQYTVFHIYM